ncbi:hypothetical protein WR25_13144 [Diploscapter pachys]|uniref:Uncharacterized protein n=1 Tax=Diploscapter pachys TaxID=2018661 RepID=A0A2A2LPX7_9BILA|nr:hypothetical protein WR25_13144 [Diploscapter pachys]
MAQSDSCLLRAALKEAKELVSTMTMDTVWTMDEKCPMESLEQKLRHLGQIIANIKADVTVQGGSLRLTWLISGPSTVGNSKLKTSISEAKGLFASGCHFTNHLVVNVEQANDKQSATIRYEKPDHRRELMKLIIGGNDYLTEGRHTVIIKMNDNRLSLSLPRLVPSVESSAISGCSLPPKIPDSLHGEVVVAKDTEKNMVSLDYLATDFLRVR